MSRGKGLAMALVAILTWMMVSRVARRQTEWNPSCQTPALIDPDYLGVTVPPNIAPLNFRIRQPGLRFEVKLVDPAGDGIRLRLRNPTVEWPARAWRELLQRNRGGTLRLSISIQESKRAWREYAAASIHVANAPIDRYLNFRAIRPLHNTWGSMELRQRDLTSFDERVVLAGRQYENGCANCHAVAAGKSNRAVISVRSEAYGSGTVIVVDGKAVKLKNKTGYAAWHPDGQLLSFTVNQVRQWFHPAAEESREVLDLKSGIGFWRVGSEAIETIPALSRPDRLLTFPTWSPDGAYLYYCSGPVLWDDFQTVPPERADEVKYDLMRLPYAACDGTWREPEVVWSAEQAGGSVMQPKVRPNGQVIVAVCDYGTFPIHRPESDLFVLNPEREGWSAYRMGVNSDTAESWHSLSQDGNWMIFSSKRRDGSLVRPYLTHLGNTTGTKPLLLPVANPALWDTLLESYNTPELATEPAAVSARTLGEAIRSGPGIELAMPEAFSEKKDEKPKDDWQQR